MTTDPIIIMVINMTVVFIVLIALMYLIKLIHFLDPTKGKEEAAEAPPPAPSVSVREEARQEEIPGEVVAAIAAAVASCGGGSVRAIRRLADSDWRRSCHMGR